MKSPFVVCKLLNYNFICTQVTLWMIQLESSHPVHTLATVYSEVIL